MKKLEASIDRLENERRGLAAILHIPYGTQAERTRELLRKIDATEKERRILEEGIRYGVDKGLEGEIRNRYEREALNLRRNWYVTLTLLLVVFFIVTL